MSPALQDKAPPASPRRQDSTTRIKALIALLKEKPKTWLWRKPASEPGHLPEALEQKDISCPGLMASL